MVIVLVTVYGRNTPPISSIVSPNVLHVDCSTTFLPRDAKDKWTLTTSVVD
jgi:hypothetical protein